MAQYTLDIQKIKGMMREHGQTQIDVSVHLDCRPMSIYNKLNGRTDFTAGEICKLADMFGENPSIFFTPVLANNAKAVDNSRTI